MITEINTGGSAMVATVVVVHMVCSVVLICNQCTKMLQHIFIVLHSIGIYDAYYAFCTKCKF